MEAVVLWMMYKHQDAFPLGKWILYYLPSAVVCMWLECPSGTGVLMFHHSVIWDDASLIHGVWRWGGFCDMIGFDKIFRVGFTIDF